MTYNLNDIKALAPIFAEKPGNVFQIMNTYATPSIPTQDVKNILICTDHANWRTGHFAAVCSMATQLKEIGYNTVLCLRRMPPAKFKPKDIPIMLNPANDMTEEDFCARAQNYQEIVANHNIDTVILNSWKGSYKYWDLLIMHSLSAATPEKRVRVLLHFHSSFTRPQFDLGANWLRNNTPIVHCFDGLLTNNKVDAAFWSNYNNHVYHYPLAIDNAPTEQAASEQGSANHAPSVYSSIIHAPTTQKQNTSPRSNVVYIARFSPTKNQLAAIDAFHYVVKALPNAKLILAGNDNKGYRDICHARVKELELVDNVEIHDYVTGNEKDQLLRSACCAINTSLFEGFSQYLCEVKAYGLPIVAFNLPNSDMLDGAEENGAIIVPNGDCEQLGVQLVRLLDSASLRQQLGAAARAHFELVTNFDYQTFWTGVFEDILVEKPPLQPHSTQRKIYDSLFDAILGANKDLYETQRQQFERTHELKQQHANDTKQIAELSKQLNAASKIIETMKNSKSWKYTRFLRFILGHTKYD